MKPALLTASLVLVAGTALACGDDTGKDTGYETGSDSRDDGGTAASAESGPPADASEEDFCANYQSSLEKVGAAAAAGGGDAEYVAAVKEWGAAMEETGTPADVSAAARSGFETMVTMISDLADTATQEDFDAIDADLSDEVKAQVDEFETYTTETCPSPIEVETPTESPSVAPSDAPLTESPSQ